MAKLPVLMKIVGLGNDRTDRERRDAFRSQMNDTILILHSSCHLNKTFMQHDHRIKDVNGWHHAHVGMAGFIFEGQKDEALGGSRSLTRDDAASRNGRPVVRKFPEFAGGYYADSPRSFARVPGRVLMT
jgi:hypothetical protein